MIDNLAIPKKTIDIIEKVTDIGNNIVKKIPAKDYELPVFTFINFLERFTNSLESINILLKNYSNNIEPSIGLLLRTGLLDFLTITYLSSYHPEIDSQENSSNFHKKINDLNTDHIRNTFKYLKLSHKNNVITQGEYNSAIENTYKNFSFLFKDSNIDYLSPEKSLIGKKFKSPKELFTRINSHHSLNSVSNVYDIYTYYSKYEHYGIMTHYLQRYSPEQNIKRILLSLEYLIFGLNLSVSFINESLGSFNQEIVNLQRLHQQFVKLSK